MSESVVVPVDLLHTYGHCAERAKPGGCQRHNLQCGYPDCDRKAISAAPTPEPSEVESLERKIAESQARDCLSMCVTDTNGWIRITSNGYHETSLIAKSIRYLELRGLLEHHPTDPNLVRVKEQKP